jgi:hypothetical protein
MTTVNLTASEFTQMANQLAVTAAEVESKWPDAIRWWCGNRHRWTSIVRRRAAFDLRQRDYAGVFVPGFVWRFGLPRVVGRAALLCRGLTQCVHARKCRRNGVRNHARRPDLGCHRAP